jgi:TonB family protein
MLRASSHKVSRATAVALLAAALLLPEIALANGDDVGVGSLSDAASERVPAVTAFPKYPSVAWRDRIEGETTVCFSIDDRGRIVRPSVRSSTHRIFEKPAMRAIRRSSFAPLAEGEKPAVVKTCRTYRFRLDSVHADNSNGNNEPPAVGTSTVEASGEDP